MAGEDKKRRLLRQWWLRTFASAPRQEESEPLQWNGDAVLLLSRDRDLLSASEKESLRERRRDHRWEEMMRGESSGQRRNSFLSERSLLEDDCHGRSGEWKLRCSPDTFSCLKLSGKQQDQQNRCTRSFELRAECSRKSMLKRIRCTERWSLTYNPTFNQTVGGERKQERRQIRLNRKERSKGENARPMEDDLKSKTTMVGHVHAIGRTRSQLRLKESMNRRRSEQTDTSEGVERISRISSNSSAHKSDSEPSRLTNEQEREEAATKIVRFIQSQRRRVAEREEKRKEREEDTSLSLLRWQEIDELLDQEESQAELEKIGKRVQDLDLFSMHEKHAHTNFRRLARLCLDDWERFIRSENSYKNVENMAKVALQDWTKGNRDSAADTLEQAKTCLEQAEELASNVQLSTLGRALDKINEMRQQSIKNLSVYLAMEETDDISRQYVRSRRRKAYVGHNLASSDIQSQILQEHLVKKSWQSQG
mmetsp:Transcript_10398/g.34699  ORF Transcript_10398/g.34699 Transcript_10398/m.34699 type:complete len:480 (+) Transcript_10398:46-1485(+)